MSKRTIHNSSTLVPLNSKPSIFSQEDSGNPYTSKQSMFHDGSIMKLRSLSSIHSSVAAPRVPVTDSLHKRNTMGSELSESMPVIQSTENHGCSMPELPSTKTVSKHRFLKNLQI
mmetsp:Transcript_37464/g.57374  ORF Transcript_37464/g.57374 Transcript_37464/m.57374 type:complete len:115 (-) Transcript_37464:486-830(-)